MQIRCADSETVALQKTFFFGEFKRMMPAITNTMLSNTLRDLEQDGLISRIQYNEMPLRVEYSLTEKGHDLMPVFYALAQWGLTYIR